MKLRKVISGGQTGADKTALICARRLGLETGGTAPKMYRTEAGVDASLRDYGLVQSRFYDYAPRTRDNVRDAEVTLWFGNVGSPGYWCTQTAAKSWGKPFHVNPDAQTLKELACTYEVWNVAGNRVSKNPRVVRLVEDAFMVVEELQ